MGQRSDLRPRGRCGDPDELTGIEIERNSHLAGHLADLQHKARPSDASFLELFHGEFLWKTCHDTHRNSARMFLWEWEISTGYHLSNE
ncbi:hypothetical protein GCM10009658_44110 [Planotetraspora silvatica]